MLSSTNSPKICSSNSMYSTVSSSDGMVVEVVGREDPMAEYDEGKKGVAH